MTSKTVTSLAFAAGCALALGAMPSAHAQTAYSQNPTLTTQPPYAGAYIGQQPGDTGFSASYPQPYYAPAMPPPRAYSGSTMPPPRAYSGSTMPPRPYMAEPNLGTRVATNGPQASRGDFGDWSAMRNNIESARYDRLLQTSPGFRNARMRKECGPIGDPQLHDQCLASFQQYEPIMVGSSVPPRRFRHHRSYGY